MATKDLAKKICRRDKAYARCRRSGRMEDRGKFQTFKKEIQRELRRAYWNYVEELVTSQDTDSNSFSSMKRFWKFIKYKATDFNGGVIWVFPP